jgi:hypothetical protein
MASRNKNNNWDRIQLGVRNTERLIRQRDYNSAMVKARQTLEFMVRMLADRDRTGSMNDSDLKEMIDILYQNRQITKTSCDRYHKIRMIGNKAAHEGDNSASNADLAFQMLSQELRVFARDYQNRRSPQRTTSRAAGSRSSRKGRRRSGRRRYRITPFDLFKLLIPVICILLLFFVIRLLKPKTDETESTSAPVSTEVPVPVETTSPIETMVPSTEIPSTETQPMVYRTTDVLNVRSEPSTDGARLGKLNSGVTVEYVRAENDEWTVILYDGREAYVASQYLTAE